MQIECRPPVYAAAPAPSPSTCTQHMCTCTSHLKLTHLPLEDCWHHFLTSLCVVSFLSLLFLFCLSACCYQSLSLSPFTFLPCSDVTPVFHFIHASCSSLINNQMTSAVSYFFSVFECQMICTCEFFPTSSLLFLVYLPDLLQPSHKFE